MASNFFIMKVLITGGAGFIGSNFVNQYLHTVDRLVCVDNLSYAGNTDNFDLKVWDNPHFRFIKEDINNTPAITKLIENHEIDCIIHMAAESHVDNSIDNPLLFAQVNSLGTLSMLHAAHNAWTNYCNKKFIYVSTDEVYGSIKTGSFTEKSRYKPNSPYSASKAAGDMFCRAYYRTHVLPVIVTHCSNNYGANQHSEKFIPTVIRSLKSGKKIPVYGDGSNIRNWLHVSDHCKGIMRTITAGNPGEIYNFGSSVELTNLEIIKTICNALSLPFKDSIEFVRDRKGHDFRYSVDSSKARTELGWSEDISFNEGIAALVAGVDGIKITSG